MMKIEHQSIHSDNRVILQAKRFRNNLIILVISTTYKTSGFYQETLELKVEGNEA